MELPPIAVPLLFLLRREPKLVWRLRLFMFVLLLFSTSLGVVVVVGGGTLFAAIQLPLVFKMESRLAFFINVSASIPANRKVSRMTVVLMTSSNGEDVSKEGE